MPENIKTLRDAELDEVIGQLVRSQFMAPFNAEDMAILVQKIRARVEAAVIEQLIDNSHADWYKYFTEWGRVLSQRTDILERKERSVREERSSLAYRELAVTAQLDIAAERIRGVERREEALVARQLSSQSLSCSVQQQNLPDDVLL